MVAPADPEKPASLPAPAFFIRSEDTHHMEAIDHLIDSSFGPGRRKRLIFRFRDGRAPMAGLCLVALAGYATLDHDSHNADRLVGSIRFWPVCMPDGSVLPMLGPLAVPADLRGAGIGRALVFAGLDCARTQGWPAVLIIGNPAYYAHFGFTADPVQGLDMGGSVLPLTFMGLEFVPGSLTGQKGVVTPVPRDEEWDLAALGPTTRL